MATGASAWPCWSSWLSPAEGLGATRLQGEDGRSGMSDEPRKWSLATECYAYTDDSHWQGPDIPEGERVEVIEAAPLYALVDEQAEDEGLWSAGLGGLTSIAEAHLQQELRRLHALIESGR